MGKDDNGYEPYGKHRLIYESYVFGRRICNLSWMAEAFYWRIQAKVADDWGNFPADPFILVPQAAGLRPMTAEECAGCVKEMEREGLIRLYLVDETDWYGHVLSFTKMQPPSQAPRGPALGRMRRYPESPWDSDIPLSEQPRHTALRSASQLPSRDALRSLTNTKISDTDLTDNGRTSYLKVTEIENCQVPKGLDRKDFVLRAFQYWQQKLKHPQSVMSPERVRLLQARWKDTSFDEWCMAVDGCESSDFHMGRQPNNPTKFDDITLIARNRSKVEFFADKIRNSVVPTREDKKKKSEEAKRRWANRS